MYEQIFELSGRMPHRLDKTRDDQLVGKTRVRERSAEFYESSDRAAFVRDEQYRSVGRCLSRVRIAPRGTEAPRQAGNDELLGIDQIRPREVEELTLLFMDIEGSTRLIHRLGDSYATVLLEHRRLMRKALEDHLGRVFDSHGDSFFASFQNSAAAARAAAAAQHALSSYPLPDDVQLKVRIGLHIGSPIAVGDGFVGLDVHRAARICAAAYGGQILLSGETANRLGDEASGELQVQELGEYTLRAGHSFEIERAILKQDLPLELLQCTRGLDAELLDERPSRLLVSPESLALPA